MKSLLLSVHDDDAVLFAAFTCMRERPLIVVCLDSYLQPARGEIGCSAEDRALESMRAHFILNCKTVRLGLHDDNVTEEELTERFCEINVNDLDCIYAPAIQGGNVHHDMVGRVAQKVFGSKVRQYTTYSKTELYTTGTTEIVPTPEENKRKRNALRQYVSQLRINRPHFDAVLDKSEWLIDSTTPQKLHIGCGRDRRDGWINLDRERGGDLQADVTCGIPLDTSSIDAVYSQDFLEHLPPSASVHVINEIWRVLKPNGTMEHYVPNAGTRNDYGSPSHLSHWNLQTFEHFDVDSYRWAKDRLYEGFIGGFRQVQRELVNWQIEDDGLKRPQSIHVIYKAVK